MSLIQEGFILYRKRHLLFTFWFDFSFFFIGGNEEKKCFQRKILSCLMKRNEISFLFIYFYLQHLKYRQYTYMLYETFSEKKRRIYVPEWKRSIKKVKKFVDKNKYKCTNSGWDSIQICIESIECEKLVEKKNTQISIHFPCPKLWHWKISVFIFAIFFLLLFSNLFLSNYIYHILNKLNCFKCMSECPSSMCSKAVCS